MSDGAAAVPAESSPTAAARRATFTLASLWLSAVLGALAGALAGALGGLEGKGYLS